MYVCMQSVVDTHIVWMDVGIAAPQCHRRMATTCARHGIYGLAGLMWGSPSWQSLTSNNLTSILRFDRTAFSQVAATETSLKHRGNMAASAV
jgi:hypothetical protein